MEDYAERLVSRGGRLGRLGNQASWYFPNIWWRLVGERVFVDSAAVVEEVVGIEGIVIRVVV